jgi:hypothetical protein
MWLKTEVRREMKGCMKGGKREIAMALGKTLLEKFDRLSTSSLSLPVVGSQQIYLSGGRQSPT